ncbi:MAG TPA: tRNA pseudouridine(13) synthase TruD [Candidatus Nitrosocosmicus sp.]|nr:tRNA pseudouridine(13) synthase TruD [Candidatus Nitrosocosmicus sp.]
MKILSSEIDKLAGIDYYTTSGKGIGGYIKKNYADFSVREIVSERFLNQLNPVSESKFPFPIYIIEKKGIDSSHAIMLLKKKTGLNLKIIGMKDAKATTVQYASSNRSNKLERMTRDYNIGTVKLSLVGYSKKPIEKNNLVGNAFKIRITNTKNIHAHNIAKFSHEIDDVGNYYGLQRFGSERLVTHLVGKAIIKRQFSKAAEILMTYTTKYDSKFSIEIREKLRDIRNNPSILKEIPRGMDIERNLARELLNGKDPIIALRSIPITIRRLFVQAFQAYLFNKTLSKAIENNFSLIRPENNDLCFEVNKNSLEFGKIRKYETEKSIVKDIVNLPIIRLPGYSFQPGNNRFDNILKEFMNFENIIAKDFFIKEMQELSESGGFRQASFYCKDFEYHIDDVESLTVEFSAPKGSYATVLLRELIKPVNPIAAGF